MGMIARAKGAVDGVREDFKSASERAEVVSDQAVSTLASVDEAAQAVTKVANLVTLGILALFISALVWSFTSD